MMIHRVLAAATVPALLVTLTACAALNGNTGLRESGSPGPAPGQGAPVAGPAATPSSGTSGASGPSGLGATPAAARTSPSDGATATRLADGRWPAVIMGGLPARRRITVDVVQWFGGDAAIAAARQDGQKATDDYYVRNASPRLRVLAVVPGAVIQTNSISSGRTGNPTQNVRSTLAELVGSDRLHEALFWVTIRNGAVTRLSEQYTP